MEKFIDIVDLKFSYDNGDESKNILNGINLEIKKGELFTILGHNGSGKSTLVQHINGLLLSGEGSVNISDEDKQFSLSKKNKEKTSYSLTSL